ncbi:MAG: CDP-alcohol phosphatidyltransferase family protein, partial [Spirochaetaceae bacterium]
MIDKVGRRIKDAFLTPMLRVVPKRVHPNSVTLLSLLPGVATALFAALGIWPWALVAFLLNRALDGLDGLLARTRGVQSDFGGYLDIMIDFLVYAAIPVGIWVG